MFKFPTVFLIVAADQSWRKWWRYSSPSNCFCQCKFSIAKKSAATRKDSSATKCVLERLLVATLPTNAFPFNVKWHNAYKSTQLVRLCNINIKIFSTSWKDVFYATEKSTKRSPPPLHKIMNSVARFSDFGKSARTWSQLSILYCNKKQQTSINRF